MLKSFDHGRNYTENMRFFRGIESIFFDGEQPSKTFSQIKRSRHFGGETLELFQFNVLERPNDQGRVSDRAIEKYFNGLRKSTWAIQLQKWFLITLECCGICP